MKKLMILLFCLLNLVSLSYSQNQTDFSEYNLTDMIATPNGTLFLATENGGIFKSDDNGKSWSLTSNITKNYNIYSMLYDDYEGLFVAANNSFLQSTDFGKTWEIRTLNNDAKAMIATKNKYKVFSDGKTCYITLDNYNSIYLKNLSVSQFAFSNDGYLYGCGSYIIKNKNIENFQSPNFENISNGLNIFSNCISIDENNRIYLGTKEGIYYSQNNGENWDLLSPDLQKYEITSLFVQNKLIVAGTNGNGVFYSTNNGKSFSQSNSPGMETKVKKIVPYNSNYYIITSGSGLFYSNDNCQSFEKVNSTLNLQADSVYAQGWMPSITFKDFNPNIGRIILLSFLDNDSTFMIKGIENNIRFYNSKSGILLREYSLPDGLPWLCYSMLSSDSLAICLFTNGKYKFGTLSTISNNFNEYISLDSANLYDEFVQAYGVPDTYEGLNCSEFNIDRHKNIAYLKYAINGSWTTPINPTYKDVVKYEIRDLKSGQVLKNLNYNFLYSDDYSYYLVDNTVLYSFNDEMIYDMKSIPENQGYSLNSGSLNSYISPHNKFIVLNDKNNNRLLVADLKSGIIKNVINYQYPIISLSITNNDNYLITISDESSIKIYNLYKSADAFDKVVFPSGKGNWQNWQYSVASSENAILFGGADGIIRLWKPDFNLTSVEEKPIENVLNKDIKISPNPATDYIEINLDNVIASPDKSGRSNLIKIYNTYGECVKTVGANNYLPLQRIDISHLPVGLYFIQIGNYSEKFMVVR
jgi:photosystem II stability/assembly factor-like uncharacterized protein